MLNNQTNMRMNFWKIMRNTKGLKLFIEFFSFLKAKQEVYFSYFVCVCFLLQNFFHFKKKM